MVEKAEAGTRKGEGRAARIGGESVPTDLKYTRTERVRTKSASGRAPSRAQASRAGWYSRELELSRTGGRKGCQGCACSACVSPFARREARRRGASARTRCSAATATGAGARLAKEGGLRTNYQRLTSLCTRRSLCKPRTFLGARPSLWPCSPATARADFGAGVRVLCSKERPRDRCAAPNKVHLRAQRLAERANFETFASSAAQDYV